MDSKAEEGRLLSGRATLRLLYDEFEPDGKNFDTDTFSDVYDLQCHTSMAGLEAYCSRIDQLRARCREKPSDGSLATRFYREVNRISQFSRDIQDYARVDDYD
eukprot:14508674-Heterocapsa_arctica.AAC.1